MELDPRPRVNYATLPIVRSRSDAEDHKSRPTTDWTDNIRDRFKDPDEDDLAKQVPGWQERVAERLKAKLRPRDGVAAANLKSWLEGAGYVTPCY